MDREDPTKALIYARISSCEREKKRCSIDAQLKLLRNYAAREGFEVLKEFVDVETAKQAGRTSFSEMISWQRANPDAKIILLLKKPTSSITTLRIG